MSIAMPSFVLRITAQNTLILQYVRGGLDKNMAKYFNNKFSAMYVTSQNITGVYRDRALTRDKCANITTDGRLISYMHFVFDTFSDR